MLAPDLTILFVTNSLQSFDFLIDEIDTENQSPTPFPALALNSKREKKRKRTRKAIVKIQSTGRKGMQKRLRKREGFKEQKTDSMHKHEIDSSMASATSHLMIISLRSVSEGQ